MDFIYPLLYCTFPDFIVCTAYFNITIFCIYSGNVAIEVIKLNLLDYIVMKLGPKQTGKKP